MYLYENHAVFFAIVMEMLITVTFIVMEYMGYSKMLKECKKGTNDNKIVNKIKNKEINVNSVDNFVDNYVNNYEFGGLKLYTIQRICGQHLSFVFITWCLACIYGVYLEVSIKELLWTTMLGILLVGVLFTIGYNVDNSKMEYIAKVSLKNTLEEYIYFSESHLKTCDELPTEKISDNMSNSLEEVKSKETPQEKRMKLKKAVFATDKTVYDGKYVVELNNDNLGYLQDYYKEEILS